MSQVYIIVVNWNGWRDTIECLESVFRLEFRDFAVIVCDNASEDGSLGHIAAWARGELMAGCGNPDLACHSTPPVRKPIPYLDVSPADQLSVVSRQERLFLLQTGSNSGFAAGNNAGLRVALSDPNFEYAWLLNNDTVVHPKALSAMVNRMEARPDAGICGSKLLYYNRPEEVQALGGSSYNLWTARVHHLGAGPMSSQLPREESVEANMKYVVGASMLVRKFFLERVGLMNECYFLYFEEIDWATRARGKWRLVVSLDSVVFHKEGGSIGTVRQSALQPIKTEYYATRNRILFTRKFYPFALGTVLLAAAASCVQRIVRGHKANARAVFLGISSGFAGEEGAKTRL